MKAVDLITEHLDIWTTAQIPKAKGRGKPSNQSGYGIKKLRALILDLAVHGKLVQQDPSDEPACIMLERIASEKDRLLKECKIKKQRVLPKIKDNTIPFDIPEAWEWSRIGDITNYGLNDKIEAANVDSDTWVLELENVEKETSRLLMKVRYSTKPFRSSKNIFLNGDVIYGKLRPYLDKVLVADEDGVCSTEMIPFRAYACITPQFLRLILKSPYFIKYANESTHGMNLPRLGTEKARLALIPIVPEPEQRRIVAKVDELMALCDQLEQQQTNSNTTHQTLVKTLLATLTNPGTGPNGTDTNAIDLFFQHFDTLFTTEESIDQLKQTILQLAVMGRLVPQDPNDEPAGKLLQRITQEKDQLIKSGVIKRQKPISDISNIETQYQLPTGWNWVRLGNALNKITDGTHHSPPNGDNGEFLYISAKNIKPEGVMLSNATYVSKEIHNEIYSRCNPEQGDILYIKDGATTGIATINNLEQPFSMLSSVALLKLPTSISNQYLLLSLRSPFFYNEMRAEMTGVAITRVTLKKLNGAFISLPPLTEQHRIVVKVKELMVLCDNLIGLDSDARATQIQLANVVIGNAIAQ